MYSVCRAEDITIRYNGSQVKVTQTKKDSVSVTIDGAIVNVESLYESHKLTLLVKGHHVNWGRFDNTEGMPTIMRWYGMTIEKEENCCLCGSGKLQTEDNFTQMMSVDIDLHDLSLPDDSQTGR